MGFATSVGRRGDTVVDRELREVLRYGTDEGGNAVLALLLGLGSDRRRRRSGVELATAGELARRLGKRRERVESRALRASLC